MTEMRSPSGGELTGKPELPVRVDTSSQEPVVDAANAAKTPKPSVAAPAAVGASSDRDAGDHGVVLWDEVKPPEAVEAKPLTKNLSDDPAAH